MLRHTMHLQAPAKPPHLNTRRMPALRVSARSGLIALSTRRACVVRKWL
jgi:hypothetical protein